MAKKTKTAHIVRNDDGTPSYEEVLVSAGELLSEGDPAGALAVMNSLGENVWKKDPDGVLLAMQILMTLNEAGEDTAEDVLILARLYLEMSRGSEGVRRKPSGVVQKRGVPEPEYLLAAVYLLLHSTKPDDRDRAFFLDILSSSDVYEADLSALAHAGFLAFELGRNDLCVTCLTEFTSRGEKEIARTGTISEEVTPELTRRVPMVLSMALLSLGRTEEAVLCAKASRSLGVGTYLDESGGGEEAEGEGAGFSVTPGGEEGARLLDIMSATGLAVGSAASNDRISEFGHEALGVSDSLGGEGTPSPFAVLNAKKAADENIPSEGGAGKKRQGGNPKVFFSVAMYPDGSFQKITPV